MDCLGKDDALCILGGGRVNTLPPYPSPLSPRQPNPYPFHAHIRLAKLN
jgi:hypothetical protein